MPRPLPLSALRAFEAAARTGSFRTAADDLNLTPSAVSHAIRGLEQALGATLFLREGRSIRVTNEGRTLMRHVERGFGELQLGIGSVSAQAPQLLRLHSAPSFAAQWLLPRLRRLLQEVEGLTVRIAAGTDYVRFLLPTSATSTSFTACRPRTSTAPPCTRTSSSCRSGPSS